VYVHCLFRGLWCGAIVAVVSAAITSLWRVYNFNWQREVDNALERLRHNTSLFASYSNTSNDTGHGNGYIDVRSSSNGGGIDSTPDNEFLRASTTYNTFIEDTPSTANGAQLAHASYRDPYDYRY
jgi:hypothetical protein